MTSIDGESTESHSSAWNFSQDDEARQLSLGNLPELVSRRADMPSSTVGDISKNVLMRIKDSTGDKQKLKGMPSISFYLTYSWGAG